MKTQTFTAPSFWASAIINMDYSGLEPDDRKELNNWLCDNGLSFSDCLTCSDSYVGRFKGQICEMVDYIFPVKGA